MAATAQQLAVLDAVQNGDKNIAVDAVAGAGKTTTIVKACGAAGDNAGFVAFNTHSADDIKKKLNGAADARTLHSMGFRILMKACPGIQKDDYKVRNILERNYADLHQSGRGRWADHLFLRDEWKALPAVISVCRQQVVLPSDDLKLIVNACQLQGVDLSHPDPDTFWKTADEAVQSVLDDTTTCDYDDMIAMPVYHGFVKPMYRTLFVDEAQDLNPAQRMLVDGASDRLIAVGDPNQAIMGFAGADEKSFENIAAMLATRTAGNTMLPLSCCFRCPSRHLDLARLLVPHITAKDGAEPGILKNAEAKHLLTGARPGDLVLCRNTAPLISLAYQFVRERVPVFVRGRAIGDGLKALVRKLRADTIVALIHNLEKWRFKQLDKLEAARATAEAIQRMNDQADSLSVLADSEETIDALIRTIDTLFGDLKNDNKVCLSTVHRAKGLEADRVWIYEPGLMPSRPTEVQERNLLYVALTRAKKELYLVDDHVRRKGRMTDWVKGVADGFSRWELTESDSNNEGVMSRGNVQRTDTV